MYSLALVTQNGPRINYCHSLKMIAVVFPLAMIPRTMIRTVRNHFWEENLLLHLAPGPQSLPFAASDLEKFQLGGGSIVSVVLELEGKGRGVSRISPVLQDSCNL